MGQLLKVFIGVFFSLPLLAQEGVSTQIDAARLNEVMEWVENAKYTLDTNLNNIQRSNIRDQEERYEALIDTILRQSGEKPNEFLMRNVLYRTKVAYSSLKQVPSSPKRDVLARMLLERGISWAQSLYEPDLNLMKLAREGKLTEVLRGTEFAKLGIEWADYMLSLYYLAPTNAVKLQLMKDLMGLMYNDINNDDAVKRVLAPISGAIVLKNNKLSSLQVNSPLDELREARELRQFLEQQITIAKQNLSIAPSRAGAQQENSNDSTQLIYADCIITGKPFRFSIGEIVIRGAYRSKVIAEYEDGRLVVEDQDDRSKHTMNANQLGKMNIRSCFGFSIGDIVIRNNYEATVIGFLYDGKIVTRDNDDGYQSVTNPQNLAKTNRRGR